MQDHPWDHLDSIVAHPNAGLAAFVAIFTTRVPLPDGDIPILERQAIAFITEKLPAATAKGIVPPAEIRPPW